MFKSAPALAHLLTIATAFGSMGMETENSIDKIFGKSKRHCANCDEWTENGTKFCDECTKKHEEKK